MPTVDCKGTYGSACSGDFASVLQADYKHRATIDWNVDSMNFQLGWRRIGDVDYASDRSTSIGAQNYIDFAASWQATDQVVLNFGIDNLFDKQAPTPEVGANHFNTVSDYDVIGRTVGLAVRYSPSF
ncbi:hypothetical protein [Paraglaciecola sp.]|uniref:hypothetical protein n=1 Tax=Paraglaciecola sp. TaxID=1920173 RepID=UPI0030F45DCD